MTQPTQGPGPSIAIYLGAVALALVLLRDHVATADLTGLFWAQMAAAGLLWSVGFVGFGGRFVRPRWKAIGKGIAFVTFGFFLLVWLGPWAWPLLILHQGLGMLGHVILCRRHGINWRTVQPRHKYTELMQKWGQGDLS